jgi:hypothetical protein
MRASTQMKLPKETAVTLKIEMTVGEMRDLLEAIRDAHAWPVSSFKEVLSQSLSKAENAYFSEHVVQP